MKKIVIGLIILFSFAKAVYCFDYIEIIQSDKSGIVLSLKPIEISFENIEIEGVKYQKIKLEKATAWLNHSGGPQLPVVSTLIGVPTSSPPRLQILQSEYIDIPDILLCPTPSIEITSSDRGDYISTNYHFDQNIYSLNQFYPTTNAEIFSIQTIRNQKVAKIHIYPFQYHPGFHVLRQYTKLIVKIIFPTQQSLIETNHISLDHDLFNQVLNEVLTNYDIAKDWRRGTYKNLRSVNQNDWYQPEFPYYKLLVSKDGIYRLEREDLLQYGIDLTGVDPQTIKIYCQGQEEPIRVSGESDGIFNDEDFIEFFGRQTYGDSTYYDEYTDTNVYWLTFGGMFGKRFEEKASLSGEFEEFTHYSQMLHFEKDLSYYQGDKGQAPDTKLVSGEGWIWKSFFPDDRFVFSFNLKDVSFEDADNCQLSFRLRGITLDPVLPDHLARISINDSVIADITFDNREEVIQTVSFKTSILKNDINQLKIHSIDTGAEINKFYFDWFELEYPAELQRGGDDIRFKIDSDEVKRISLWELTSNDFGIYNLTRQYYLSNFEQRDQQRYIIELLSAGFDDGNFCQIQINSENIIFGGHRGHNIAIFDTSTGLIEDKKWFDTLDREENSDSMAAYISRIPEGRVVLVGIRDEGSYRMTEAAYQALESLGSALARQVGFRDSYVLLGRKGATPGTVPEIHVPRGQGQAVLKDTLYTYHQNSRHIAFQDSFYRWDEWVIIGTDSMKKPDQVIHHQYKNLRNETNGADYIFITHYAFQETAEKFAGFWSQRNYRTFIADIQDIYDEFNYGIKNPIAIKRFLQYTYEHWQKPAPMFVLLVGNGSWDPKKNSPTSVKEDFIPVWGNPVADIWYVCLDGEDDMLPDMFIGRLSIETNEEGERIYRKVVNYVNSPTASWKKQLLFINGGFDDREQNIFGYQSEEIINNYVKVPPASCLPFVISKELDGLYEGENREEIVNAINEGKLWVNFIGHGGSGTWELMFHDQQVFQLENEDRLPLVTSFTCHTGRFANPEINNFGENFVNYSDAGAIGFVGSTGWGFVYEDYLFADKLFEIVLKDTVRQLGMALTIAKIKFWAEVYPDVRTESIVYQYSLLGDPALCLALPDKPDLMLNENGISWKPLSPVEADSVVRIQAEIDNYGLATVDSVQLMVFNNFGYSGAEIVFDGQIPAVGYCQSIDFPLEVNQKAGEHVLTFFVDPENRIVEADENNNQLNQSIFVGASRLTISRPQKSALITDEYFRLQIYNPIDSEVNPTYVFQIDTMPLFRSSGMKQSQSIQEGTIVTYWEPPSLKPDQLYFWRCRAIENSTPGNWVQANFFLGNEFGWMQRDSIQFLDDIFNNVEFKHSGVQLIEQQTIFRVESAGYDDLNYAIIFINSSPVSTATRGHNIAVCDQYGNFIEFQKFDTYDSQEDVAAMVNFLNNIPESYYVLVGIMDSAEKLMTEEAYQALESIGSQYCRNVGFRDSWAIIGKKGAAIGSVPEKLVKRYEGVAIVQDTVTTYKTEGYLFSDVIGPANSWKKLTWEGEYLSGNNSFTIDILGYNKKGYNWEVIASNVTNYENTSLTQIDSKTYSFLKLKGNFKNFNRFSTPVLKAWKVTFDPVCDVAISDQVVIFSADTLLEGTPLKVTAKVYNVGYVSEDSVRVNLYSRKEDGIRENVDSCIVQIEANTYALVNLSWDTRDNAGVNQINLEVDPNNEINELSEANNYVVKNIVVKPDTIPPEIVVTFNGRQILAGDFVAQNPVILIKVFDQNPVEIEGDTSKFHILLDGERVQFYGNENVMTFLPTVNEVDTSLRALIKFTPTLNDGDHILDVFVYDATNNSNYYHDEFKVISKLSLLNVFNYPNPFSKETNFTFHLTQPAEQVVVKIFTTTGRLIHKIESFYLEAGYHQIFWNGRDTDGDELANGVYLYKIIARSANDQTEKVEKVVIMR